MAELLKNIISWVLKTALGLIIGMQLTRNLVAPALDSLRRTVIGKTASALPGVGNAIDAVTEMVIGSAALIRNCVGAVAVVILFSLRAGTGHSGGSYRIRLPFSGSLGAARVRPAHGGMPERYGHRLRPAAEGADYHGGAVYAHHSHTGGDGGRLI